MRSVSEAMLIANIIRNYILQLYFNPIELKQLVSNIKTYCRQDPKFCMIAKKILAEIESAL